MPYPVLITVAVAAVIAVVLIIGPVGPTGRAAFVALGIAGLAIVVPPVMTYGLAIGLVMLCVIDALAAIGRTPVTREAPKILPRGVPVDLIAGADPPLGTKATLRQPPTPEIAVEPSVQDSPINARITGRRRGRHLMPGIAVRVTGPLRLSSWRRVGTGDSEVLVYPDIVAAERIVARIRRNRFSDPSRMRRGPLGLGTEFETIREYQPDDDIRQVNWRATARTARPMSNQFRIEQDRDVLALVDCGRVMAAPLGELTRLDVALDAVAALARTADEVGDRSGIVAFDEVVRREVRPQRNSGERVIRASFDLEPRSVDADYELAFRVASRRKRAFVCLFTDLFEERAAHPLIDAMPWLVRKHHVVVASITDPDIVGAVAVPPNTAQEAYRAVAALDVLDARATVVATLERAGARVIEGPTTTFSELVVAAYLDAKRRNRI
jgi:uncharacterized protein (DUF58 family)